MEKHTKKRLTKKSLLFVFDKPNKKTHAQLYAKNKQKKSILSKKDLLCLSMEIFTRKSTNAQKGIFQSTNSTKPNSNPNSKITNPK